MTKYRDQIASTQAAHMASRAISDASTVLLDEAWDKYLSGRVTDDGYLREVKSIVRKSYNDAAVVAKNLTIMQSELAGWEPSSVVGNTAYLESLVKDVERNFTEYQNSAKLDKDERRARLKFQLSAITAAERGFTDSQIIYYGELRELGYKVRKLWLANFINNEPCADCVNLTGVVVDFDAEFPIPTLMRTSIYRDLQGPPLHIRCKCVMVVLITTAENIREKLPSKRNVAPTAMSTNTVKKLPKKIFDAIIRALRAVSRRFIRE